MFNLDYRKNKNRSSRSNTAFFIFLAFLFPLFSQAQCAMCRASLESEGNAVQAKAINDGIVYLMIIPYVLVAVAGYAIYKIKYSKKKISEE
jgi:hypothetical protein